MIIISTFNFSLSPPALVPARLDCTGPARGKGDKCEAGASVGYTLHTEHPVHSEQTYNNNIKKEIEQPPASSVSHEEISVS